MEENNEIMNLILGKQVLQYVGSVMGSQGEKAEGGKVNGRSEGERQKEGCAC